MSRRWSSVSDFRPLLQPRPSNETTGRSGWTTLSYSQICCFLSFFFCASSTSQSNTVSHSAHFSPALCQSTSTFNLNEIASTKKCIPRHTDSFNSYRDTFSLLIINICQKTNDPDRSNLFNLLLS